MSSYIIPYSQARLTKLLLKLPVFAYRLGLGAVVGWTPVMVLTTRGRKSGEPRFTPVEYRRHGSKLYVISGWGVEAQWVQNLLHDPDAAVKIGHRHFAARAALVTDSAEAARALYMYRQVSPVLNRFGGAVPISLRNLDQTAASYTIMRLDILNAQPTLPGVPANWMWVWPLTIALLLVVNVAAAFARRGASEHIPTL
jgi:deazaflavin-dependent oxidoreductase (nitroreductase family)